MHFGYWIRSGRAGDRKYWYQDYDTQKIFQGPKPSASIVRMHPRRPDHPEPAETEPSPFINVMCGNPERMVTKDGVLWNEPGLVNPVQVAHREIEGLTRAQKALYNHVTLTTPIRVESIFLLHRIMFGDLYPWAGKIRTVDLSPTTGTFKWPSHLMVPSGLAELERDYLLPLTPVPPRRDEEVPLRVAKVTSAFLLVHPFRDGNGRVSRLLGDWLALQANLPPIRYHSDDEGRQTYIEAIAQGYVKNYEPLAALISNGIEEAKNIADAGPSSRYRRQLGKYRVPPFL